MGQEFWHKVGDTQTQGDKVQHLKERPDGRSSIKKQTVWSRRKVPWVKKKRDTGSRSPRKLGEGAVLELDLGRWAKSR